MNGKRQRIAVIGAGPSGMAVLRAFEAAERAGVEVPEIVAFEKQDDWGGQWNFDWRSGTDKYGEPVHSSMYRNLWSNGPKEALEFADYTFDEHFGRPISSYPPREVLWDYIDGRMRRSAARARVRFATAVRWVQRSADGGFDLTSEDLKTRESLTERFDRVVVATGHFSYPNVPGFAGIETFPGTLHHAHDFRGAEKLRGQRVLLIGASYSAEDIGIQAHKMGAARVTMSYRSRPQGYDWPAGVEELPIVERFEGRTVHFSDGQTREVDAVILCTGYLHHYPFLPQDLALDSPNTLYPQGLYRGVVWNADPDVFYVGAQDQWFTFNMFDAQAWFVRDVILGRVALPDAEERQTSMAQWHERFLAAVTDDEQVAFQGAYIRDLIERTDYPMFDIDEVVAVFQEWKREKKENILTYRDQVHRSVMTGTMAQRHHTAWLDELDDSAERYLMQPEQAPALA